MMTKRLSLPMAAGLGFLAASSLAWLDPALADDPQPTPAVASEASDSSQLPIEELRTFAEVFERIKEDYVEPVDDKTLLESAIRGMLAGLDPHSSYLDSDAYQDLRVGTSGEFGGLGITVGTENGFIKVISPIDDTPAQRAGIQPGDLIVRIDQQPVKDLSLSDAVKLMRGEPGTEIHLTIAREGEEHPIEVTIKRDVIHVASVKSHMIEPGYAYIRLTQFQSRTPEEMTEAIDQLQKDNKGALQGLVLDLRNNPGGVLNSAVGVSDAFLTGGLIVYTQGRQEDTRTNYEAGPDDILSGAPIVVLVNGGSASASEIVAGALQDQHRALIMGSQTFGKGSVQTIVPIDNTTALKLTTARYYTPSGRSIQAQGIHPDIELERGEFKPLGKADISPVKEADLAGHLAEDPDSKEIDMESDQVSPATDYQVIEALNVLKGISLTQSRAAH